uniref:Uncharacterized protein n=1 Tax=Salmo trutta TaxID=8032 RepID=A0A673WDL0_SALTR
MSVHMEERSGVIPCKTPWGNWSQTMEERSGVFIKVNVPCGTSVADSEGLHIVSCISTVNDLGISVADEGTWTLEGEYCADAWLQDQKQRKLTLERFHRGGDTMKFSPISGAEISGNFAGGGPDFYSLQK